MELGSPHFKCGVSVRRHALDGGVVQQAAKSLGVGASFSSSQPCRLSLSVSIGYAYGKRWEASASMLALRLLQIKAEQLSLHLGVNSLAVLLKGFVFGPAGEHCEDAPSGVYQRPRGARVIHSSAGLASYQFACSPSVPLHQIEPLLE